MANNKVKYNLKNAHYALLHTAADGTVSYDTPVALPGAVSIALDASGEPENFYADGVAYYVINNNMGYEGDLELALIPEAFRVDVLNESLDDNGVLVENSDSELNAFALLFEFDGDQRHIRHVLYNCSASRPGIEGKTNEEEKEVQTETITLKATPLASGIVKAKSGNTTNLSIYNTWYNAVYLPVVSFGVTPTELSIEKGATGTVTLKNATGTVTATVTKSGSAATGVTCTIADNTATIAVTSSATAGAYVVTFSDDGTTPASTATVALTVTAEA